MCLCVGEYVCRRVLLYNPVIFDKIDNNNNNNKELTTKEHIVMHTHLNFIFKWALHYSTLAIKLKLF